MAKVGSQDVSAALNGVTAPLVGAVAGLLSFPVGEVATSLFPREPQLLQEFITFSAMWSGSIGCTIGTLLLVWSNLQSLRGQWYRDVPLGVPVFFCLSFMGGALGQITYSMAPNSVTRGIGWALMGTSVGMGIGLLRRDLVQSGRGALGGLLGGFVGGFIFNGLGMFTSANDDGSVPRAVGQILMGAAISGLIYVVQQAMKNAWLMGISTGPYEGKEYPLNTSRVTVGRDQSNDIALFREESVPRQLGSLVYEREQWWWRGEATVINGVPQQQAALRSGDTLQFGATNFRFRLRGGENAAVPATAYAPAGSWQSPSRTAGPTVLATPGYSAPAGPTVLAGAQTPAPSAAPLPAYNFMALSGQLFRVPAEAQILVGRTPENQLVLPEATVSSRHARLDNGPTGLTLTDLGSTNGTSVNGTPLTPHQPHPIKPGDRIKFGGMDTTLRAG